jgi:hypothetical protein
MRINSDINVLGSILDLTLIEFLLKNNGCSNEGYIKTNGEQYIHTNIKTTKSYKRFKKAIYNTILKFYTPELEILFEKVVEHEGISPCSLRLIFWNASFNNELFDYLNEHVYFPAMYSGRATLKNDEVLACLNDLKQTEAALQKWSYSTLQTTASKYLTLLRKVNLMEGGAKKSILYQQLNEKDLVLFIYWLLAIENKPNLLESKWLKYCFMEKIALIQYVLQKKFTEYINVDFSGDSLKIKSILPYEVLFDELKK